MFKYNLLITLEGFGYKHKMDRIEKDARRIPLVNVLHRNDYGGNGDICISVPFKWMGLYLMKKHRFIIKEGVR